MNLKLFTITILLACAPILSGQDGSGLNKTDSEGRKQGQWTVRYSNGNILYEGFFRDDYPEGEFRRYYEDQDINSVMIFSDKGRKAEATIYYPGGSIAARGIYVNRMKEGRWKFYSSSIPGYLINEEEYAGNMKNGLSLKFYSDSSIAEKVTYRNDKKEGEWIQYYASGKIFLKSSYSGGMLNGKFEVWYENGKPEISGEYRNNLREGRWIIYNEDGTERYEQNYTLGMTNDRQMDIDAAEIIDNMEKNRGKIADPQNTGEIR
ncbi:MAG TPA: hypothetical protein PLO24_02690 [Bacteroidales bacterium]|jgi:antitoxin component YwqK of YwqJK toxin-antitoxin module|nr:hypothetical protein [Bacteroidales bacterium]HOS72095.1 hypothetical protein [Bacteroidales bacterium]HQH25667.1 hypothetical protein [Bacteroidales bacterium]HQJ83313.1 hypothetical protein [Bacteroidales bacterium]